MKFKNFLLTALFVGFGTCLTACEDTTGTDPVDNPKPKSPSNVMATSINATTVRIKWDAAADTNVASYVLYVNGVKQNTAVTSPCNIDGLTEGTLYRFEVRSVSKKSLLSDSNVAYVQWSPATRFVKNDNGADIVMYESDSKMFGSGISLFDSETETPRTYKVANGDKWDMGLYTKDNALLIGSPSKLGYTFPGDVNTVEFASTEIDATSLDDVYDSQALNQKTFSEKTIDLSTKSNSFVAIARIKYIEKAVPNDIVKYQYAKVLVEKGANGFLQDAAPNRFVKVQISYQKVLDVPFAR